MRSFSFTFRRKFEDVANKNEKGEALKVPYGNAKEKVTSGPNKDKEVPCFKITSDLIPENVNELQEQLETDENFSQLMEWVYENAILAQIRAYFAKLQTSAPEQENTEEGRREVIKRCEEIGKTFTLASLFAKAISSTSVTETLNSAEMRDLAVSDPVEFARKTLELLARVK